MPSTGDQSSLNLCERYVRNSVTSQASNVALGCNELCDRLLITELGVQIVSATSLTSMDLIVRTKNTFGHNLQTAAAGFTERAAWDASHQLTAVGTSIWRPEFGAEILSVPSKVEPYEGRRVIQFQTRTVFVGTDWTGYFWMKWIPLTET